MIVDRTAVAKKTIAVVLALALFGFAPSTALARVRAAAAPVVGMSVVGAIGTSGPTIIVPPITLSRPTLSPVVFPPSNAALMSQVVVAQAFPFPQPVVGRHTVDNPLNVRAKGVELPRSLSNHEDAARELAVALAMPEGPSKLIMISLSKAIAANNAGHGAFSALYDATARGGSEVDPVYGQSGFGGGVRGESPAAVEKAEDDPAHHKAAIEAVKTENGGVVGKFASSPAPIYAFVAIGLAMTVAAPASALATTAVLGAMTLLDDAAGSRDISSRFYALSMGICAGVLIVLGRSGFGAPFYMAGGAMLLANFMGQVHNA